MLTLFIYCYILYTFTSHSICKSLINIVFIKYNYATIKPITEVLFSLFNYGISCLLAGSTYNRLRYLPSICTACHLIISYVEPPFNVLKPTLSSSLIRYELPILLCLPTLDNLFVSIGLESTINH
jgi:hypothetical protein